MTDYETKSLKLLSDINTKLGLLLGASGLSQPEAPARKPMNISEETLAKARSQLGTIKPLGGWMAR